MTEQEYKAKIAEIEKAAVEAKRQASIEYCKSIQKYFPGDIITTGSHTIKVEKMVTIWSSDGSRMPYCRYDGIRLTQKLEPFKNGERESMFESEFCPIKKLN